VDSQFDAWENPQEGFHVKASQSAATLTHLILEHFEKI
jgi:hypothetical protein